MTAYAFGTVVLLPFPFTNQIQVKRRPAVVISGSRYNALRPDVVVMPITSQLQAQTSDWDVILTEWQKAGLVKPSAVKPLFATIEKAIVIRSLGSLAEPDQIRLARAIGDCLEFVTRTGQVSP